MQKNKINIIFLDVDGVLNSRASKTFQMLN